MNKNSILNWLYFLILIVLFSSCKASHSSASNSDKKTNQLRENLVDNATEQIGSPYKFGGTTKNGFDCSGLVYTSYKKEAIVLPRTSLEMSNYGKRIKKEDARKADLIFFKTDGSRQINHVGLIIETKDNDIKFIHSSTKKGVIVSSLNEAYYQKTFSHINRPSD